MTAEPATYELPENMRVEDCAALDQFLRDTNDRAVRINAAHTVKFGGLAAQTIAAHQKIRGAGDTALTIDAPSEGMRNALTMMGLDALLDQTGAAA